MAKRGFTLLEVLVAVAILGLALTVILSSQVGLFASSKHAENLTHATALARCRMTELEERLLREGFPAIDASENGPCCDDEANERMSCEWKIETIELPEPKDPGELGGGDADGGAGDIGPLGALAALQAGGTTPGAPTDLSSLGSTLGGAAEGAASGLAPLVMGMVYPQLKSMLEASIRKVTVSVVWKEGRIARNLSITQYVTNPTQGGLDPNADKGLEDLSGLIPPFPGGPSPSTPPTPTTRGGVR